MAGVFINVISFWVESYRVYLYLNLCVLVVSSVIYLFLVESPFYLHHSRDIQGLYKSLVTICSYNFTENELPKVKEQLQFALNNPHDVHLTQFKTDTNRPPKQVADLFGDDEKDSLSLLEEAEETAHKGGLWTFLKLMIVFCQAEAMLYMALILNKQLGISSVQISGILITVFQTLGFLTGLLFAYKVGRRSINISTCVVICVLSLTILVIDLVNNLHVQYQDRSWGVRIAETGTLTSALSGTFVKYMHAIRELVHVLH